MSTSEKLGIPSDAPILGWMLDHGWFVALLSACLISPGMLYIVAFLFEKRLAPIWRNQFASFIPGDFMLGIVFAASVALAKSIPGEDHWYRHGWFNIVCIAYGVVVFLVGHFVVDGNGNYTRRQLSSPSKIYHDIVLFIGYGALLLRVAIPTLIYGQFIVWRVVMVLAFLAFVALLVADAIVNPRQLRKMRSSSHPERGFCPIWSKKPFVNNNQ